MKVNVHDAKTNFSKLLDRAHSGEEIIIAKGGKPYARLVPLNVEGPRKPGLLRGVTLDKSFFDALPEQELAAWEGKR